MKLALAYSTKDQVGLSERTFPVLRDGKYGLLWCDGSKTDEGKKFWAKNSDWCTAAPEYVTGGADAAIAWKLTKLLALRKHYTHIGLIENDVLLDPDWYEPTMALFEKGREKGLEVGAVSPRSYVDRILIQQPEWAVMHNCGAGVIIFTREAAEIVLRSFRTAWWPTNRYLFAQLSGVDLASFACFAGQEQMVTTDWQWEAQLAAHGLATLALTPSKASMIGQVPSLKDQGLELTQHDNHGDPLGDGRCQMTFERFECYRDNLQKIRQGLLKVEQPGIIHSQHGGQLFFPHQMGYLAGGPAWRGTLELKWAQGWGPFAYRAGTEGAFLSVRVSGSCSFLVSGGDAGAKVNIRDTRSGFNFNPDLPPEQGSFQELTVPGGPVRRTIELKLSEGAVFYGIQTADPQMLDTEFRFSWDQLPPARS